MSDAIVKKYDVIDQVVGIWNLSKGSHVLDIGCGQGEMVEYLQNEYGFDVCGIDISKEVIKKGLERNPKLNIQYGDGEFLDNFPSYSFNGIVMKDVLAAIGLPDEALHEAYCVLKKGGKLFISDYYIKNPSVDFLLSVKTEAEKERNTPHHHDHEDGVCGSGEHIDKGNECSDCSDCGECDEDEHDHENIYMEEPRYRAVDFRNEDKFLMEPLIEQMKEIGFINIVWKDCFDEEEKFKPLNADSTFQTGYFMLTAEKPL